MKKNLEYNSCKELPKKFAHEQLNLKIKEKQTSPITQNINLKSQKISTLAQAIPTLPESKFFPSSGRNLHISQNSGQIGHTVSANISTTSSANNSLVSPMNLSVQRPAQNASNLNFSLYNPRNEPISKIVQWGDIPLPATPVVVLKTFSNKLVAFEQAEILKYPAIYCIGIDAKKIKSGMNCGSNFGYDDENGDYKAIIKDHVAFRYEIFEIIGKGSFAR